MDVAQSALHRQAFDDGGRSPDVHVARGPQAVALVTMTRLSGTGRVISEELGPVTGAGRTAVRGGGPSAHHLAEQARFSTAKLLVEQPDS